MTKPKCVWSQLKVILFVASLTTFSGPTVAQDPCNPSICGENTNCELRAGRAVCSCMPGYFGNPIISCIKGECAANSDCDYSKSCQNSICVNACIDICGIGAHCEVKNHIPVCSCPVGYTGDPFSFCRYMQPEQRGGSSMVGAVGERRLKMSPLHLQLPSQSEFVEHDLVFGADELCSPSPCGKNTKCDVINNVPTCSCLQGYRGSPLKGCIHECESDNECRYDQTCTNYRCRPVCTSNSCGTNARCQPLNHKPNCTCPEGHIGNPYGGCRTECERNSECPTNKPTCWYGRCTDPCQGACGQNAECHVRGNVAVCSCPKHLTGHPMDFCRPFTNDDLCEPSPCGSNAICRPGKDSSGKDRPVCTCPPGYVGNALHNCRKGECSVDADCRSSEHCDRNSYECLDICSRQCGVGAICTARNHHAICSCPPGYNGDATRYCTPNSSRFGKTYY